MSSAITPQPTMKRRLLPTIATALVALFATSLVLVPSADAQGATLVVSDSQSCAVITGTWADSTCTVEYPGTGQSQVVITSGDTLEIPTGVTIDLVGMSIEARNGWVNNHGQINLTTWRNGAQGRSARVGTYGSGTVNNYGTITSLSEGRQPVASFEFSNFNNYGTIDVPAGEIYVRDTSRFTNVGSIDGSVFSVLNEAAAVNSGQITVNRISVSETGQFVNECDGVLTANIFSGSPVLDLCNPTPSDLAEVVVGLELRAGIEQVLLTKVELVQTALDDGLESRAVRKVDRFITKAENLFDNGRITSSQRNSLIGAALAVRETIRNSPPAA